MPVQVNITTQVNSKGIKRVTHNGREHVVLPSYTLPANVVMNGGLYTNTEIDKHYKTLDGTLAPLGHPTVNGAYVSAFSPEGINGHHVGSWNRNVKKVGDRIYMEKWVDVEFAMNTEGGRDLMSRVEAIEKGEEVNPISTSVAAFLDRMEANEEQKKNGIEWVAKISHFDHDAILLDEEPAASTDQGVGLFVNTKNAVKITANAEALSGETYRGKEQRLSSAAKEHFTASEYIWVADFTDTQVIVFRDDVPAMYDYTDTDGAIVFSDAGVPVERQESWVTMVANSIKSLFNNQQARPVQPKKEGDMPLTPEEKAELVKDIGASVATNMAEQLKPITAKIDTLEANHETLSESLTANQRAEESEMREAVKAKFGEVVANSLSGEALKDMFKQCGDAANLGTNAATTGNSLVADVANLPKE